MTPVRADPPRFVLGSCEHVFVSGDASILHADLDSFYASVEQRDNPRLRGRPVAVGGGVVLAASYEAKAFGVHSAMGGHRARALCPQIIVLAPRFPAYMDASRAVFAIFADTAPVVEGISIDEAFLDVRGLGHISGTPVEIAATLRRRVREEVGLPITVGVARTKFLAKVASGVAKPDGLLVVEPGNELNFLHPLPVQRLWGVGPKTAAKLQDRSVRTVGDVAALDPSVLAGLLGPGQGRHLHALAHNRDPRPVRSGRRRRSIGAQRALGSRSRSSQEVVAALIGLVDRATRRLRAAHRLCRTVVLRLRFADFERVTRSRTLADPSADTARIVQTATELLGEQQTLIAQRRLTLIGVTLTNLCDSSGIQLVLPLDRGGELDAAVDEVKARFGANAITRGSLVRQRADDVPRLPD
jgi:DNA polymerase-4